MTAALIIEGRQFQKVYTTQIDENDNIVGYPYKIRITDGIVAGQLRLDKATESVQMIEYEHHEIHAGSHFFLCDYDASIAVNETIQFVLTTPNTAKWIHLTFDFSSILGASLDIYEGASDVVGGSAGTPINNDRNSSTTSVVVIVKDPESITTGSRIAGFLAGANRVGGVNSRGREIILKQNTKYLFKFTSLANSNAISFCGEWYEHQNKN